MGTLFDTRFCTTDFDTDMLEFIEANYPITKSGDWGKSFKYLKYGTGNNYFWCSNSPDGLYAHFTRLTKQELKDKIGMP